MRRKLALILVIILSLVLTSCVKQKAEEKLAEKLGEKILEKATGSKVDLSLDGKSNEIASIKTDEMEMLFGEDLPWPQDKLFGISKPKGVKVISITDSLEDETISVGFVGMDLKGSRDFVDYLKGLGFKSNFESESAQGMTYSGVNPTGLSVSFFLGFDQEEVGSAQLIIAQGEESDYGLDEEAEEAEDIFKVEDFSKWPEGFIKDSPELKGKIKNQISTQGMIMISLEEVDKKDAEDFVDQLKARGFTLDSYDMKSADNLMYMASNEAGETITINWGTLGDTVVQLNKN